MAEIRKRAKALSVSPLKASQPMGAALAFLGIQRAIPMLHGSQGCTAFGKIFFVRHFREPIPLQTSAMDQVSAIMGADDNVVEGLRVICEKSRPALIGLPTTGLSETQGADIQGAVKAFRARYPQYHDTAVVALSTPDFVGCLESGFAAALSAMIETLVPADGATRPGTRPRQVNLLCGSGLTPGDVEALKDLVASFGLRPVALPDLSDSLDGHLIDADFSPLSVGGMPVAEFATLGDAVATLAVGPSVFPAASLLQERTGVPVHHFDHLLGLEATDALLMALTKISGAGVPARLERERARLTDAMVDTHFMLGQARFAIAADPDMLLGFSRFLVSMGAETSVAVTPARSAALGRVASATVQLGDLEDLEMLVRERGAEMIVGNSHALDSAQRLGLPLLRAGFPLYDQLGGHQRVWIGYGGARQLLFELANTLLTGDHHGIAPYRSRYARKSAEETAHAPATSFETH